MTSEIAFLTRTDISGMSSDVKGQLIVCDIPCEDCRSSITWLTKNRQSTLRAFTLNARFQKQEPSPASQQVNYTVSQVSQPLEQNLGLSIISY